MLIFSIGKLCAPLPYHIPLIKTTDIADPCTKGYQMDLKQGLVSKIPYKEFFVEMEISKCSQHGHGPVLYTQHSRAYVRNIFISVL